MLNKLTLGFGEKSHHQKPPTPSNALQFSVSEVFINISDKWEDPELIALIGTTNTPSGRAINVIYDFESNTVLYGNNVLIPFSKYTLEGILGLDPYQRWNIATKQKMTLDPAKQMPKISTPQEYKDKLNKTFLPEYLARHYSFKSFAMNDSVEARTKFVKNFLEEKGVKIPSI